MKLLVLLSLCLLLITAQSEAEPKHRKHHHAWQLKHRKHPIHESNYDKCAKKSADVVAAIW